MNVSSSSASTDSMSDLLKMMQSQSTEMAQKLIKMDAQVSADVQDLQTKETIVDMYA